MVSKVWEGQTVVCIASGPSLTQADCDLVRRSGLPTVAVNSSWRMARFADVIYAGDAAWWDAYGDEVTIPAERWTCTRLAAQKHGINLHKVVGPYNSGMRAIQFAIERGAERVILLGYDCSIKHGLHWHGAHDRTKNPDEKKVRTWRGQFQAVAILAKVRRCEVINCSRYTELTCFPRIPVEDILEAISDPARPGPGAPESEGIAAESAPVGCSQSSRERRFDCSQAG